MKSECERDLEVAIDIANAWEQVSKNLIIAMNVLLNEPAVQSGISPETKRELQKAVESSMEAARKGRNLANIRLVERHLRNV